MNITKLLSAQDPAGAGLTANITVDLATPLQRDGRTFYRQLYFLAFKLEPGCQGIAIDTAATQWQGQFDAFILPLTSNNTTFQTQNWESIKEEGNSTPNLVKVHLTHPWHLQSVSTIDVRGVEVLRLDGGAVSNKPTTGGNANATMPGDFVGQDFALRKVAPFSLSLQIAEDVAQIGNQPQVILAKKKSSGAGALAPGGGVIGDIIQTQANAAIVASHGIKTINLKSLPTGPRILLGDIGTTPNASANLLSLFQQAGEQTQLPVPFFSAIDQRQSALQQLQQTLDRYFAERESNPSPPPLPSYLYLPLAFDSDTPARLRLAALNIHYSLLRTRFDGLEAKHTLKFTGSRIDTQPLAISLPEHSVIKSASILLTSHLKAGSLPGAISSASPLSQCSGLDLAEGSAVASRVNNLQPLHLQQVLLAVLPLTDQVQVLLEILQDNQDTPTGTLLTQTSLTLDQPSQRQWVVAGTDPVLLDSGPCWLRLTVQQGRLFWLGQNGEGHVRITAGIGAGKVLRSLQLLQILGEISGSNAGNCLAIQVGTIKANSNSVGDGKGDFQFDLAAGLNKHFADSAAPATVDFISGSQGNVTLSRLQVEYYF